MKAEEMKKPEAEIKAAYEKAKQEVKVEYNKKNQAVWYYYCKSNTKARKVKAARGGMTIKYIPDPKWIRADKDGVDVAELLSKHGLTIEDFLTCQDNEYKENCRKNFELWASAGVTSEHLQGELKAEYEEYLASFIINEYVVSIEAQEAAIQGEADNALAAVETEIHELKAEIKAAGLEIAMIQCGEAEGNIEDLQAKIETAEAALEAIKNTSPREYKIVDTKDAIAETEESIDLHSRSVNLFSANCNSEIAAKSLEAHQKLLSKAQATLEHLTSRLEAACKTRNFEINHVHEADPEFEAFFKFAKTVDDELASLKAAEDDGSNDDAEEDFLASLDTSIDEDTETDELVDEAEPVQEKIYVTNVLINPGNFIGKHYTGSLKEFKNAMDAFNYLKDKERHYAKKTHWLHEIYVCEDVHKLETVIYRSSDCPIVDENSTVPEIQELIDAEKALIKILTADAEPTQALYLDDVQFGTFGLSWTFGKGKRAAANCYIDGELVSRALAEDIFNRRRSRAIKATVEYKIADNFQDLRFHTCSLADYKQDDTEGKSAEYIQALQECIVSEENERREILGNLQELATAYPQVYAKVLADLQEEHQERFVDNYGDEVLAFSSTEITAPVTPAEMYTVKYRVTVTVDGEDDSKRHKVKFNSHTEARNFVRQIMTDRNFEAATIEPPNGFNSYHVVPALDVFSETAVANFTAEVQDLKAKIEDANSIGANVTVLELEKKLRTFRTAYEKELVYTTLAMEPADFCKLYENLVSNFKTDTEDVDDETVTPETQQEVDTCLWWINKTSELVAKARKEIEADNLSIAKIQARWNVNGVLTAYARTVIGNFNTCLVPQCNCYANYHKDLPDFMLYFTTNEIYVWKKDYGNFAFHIQGVQDGDGTHGESSIALADFETFEQFDAALQIIKARLADSPDCVHMPEFEDIDPESVAKKKAYLKNRALIDAQSGRNYAGWARKNPTPSALEKAAAKYQMTVDELKTIFTDIEKEFAIAG